MQHLMILKKRKRMDWRKLGFLFVTLALPFTFFLVFGLYPNLVSLWYSLLQWDGILPQVFVGLNNFKVAMTDPYVWNGLKNSLLIMVCTVPLQMVIALLLSFGIVDSDFKEKNVYKLLFYFPNIIPSVMIAMLWSFVYDGDLGLLNGLLKLINPSEAGKFWLADKDIALYCLMLPMIWGGVGGQLIMYLNAMTAIPSSLYETCQLEGATKLQKLWYVTLPLIKGTLITSGTFCILGAMQTFELIMLMTGGGPSGSTSTVAMYMYNLAFTGSNTGSISSRMYGYASAVGTILMIVLMGTRLILERVSKYEVIEY